jgi:hypothetical protein
MSDWKIYAREKKWGEIDLDSLTHEEEKELLCTLENNIPLVTRGYSADTYQDFALPSECPTKTEAMASALRNAINNKNFFDDLGEPYAEITQAVEAARLLLTKHNINFLGMEETFVQRRPDGTIEQIQPTLPNSKLSKVKYFCLHATDNIENLPTFECELPTGIIPLLHAWHAGLFGRRTPLDHALYILDSNEKIKELKGGKGSWFGYYRIGKHFEAIRLNPLIKEAHLAELKAQERRENGRLGGLGRKKKRAYDVLNKLANERLNDFAFSSDKQSIRIARQIARRYDLEHGETLFQRSGVPFSHNWYQEWLHQFRETKNSKKTN